jgi:hypothetical protein
MKNTFLAIVSVLWVPVSVGMAQHSVPYADTYESYSLGSNLVGTVWQGDVTTARAVVTGVVYTPPSVGYSVTNPPTHAQVMSFSDGPITNVFDGTTSNLTVVALDTMIQPTFADTPSGTQMGPVTNSQALYQHEWLCNGLSRFFRQHDSGDSRLYWLVGTHEWP